MKHGITAKEIVVIVAILVVITTIATSNLRKSNIQPSGSSAGANLRLLSSVQLQYSEKFGTYGTLEQLCNAGYIDSVLGSGVKQGYSFHMNVDGAKSWCCIMRPVVWGIDGERNFLITTDGVIYVNTKKDSTEFKEEI